jgi:hypothetical protein
MNPTQQAPLVEEDLDQLPGEDQGRRDDEPSDDRGGRARRRGHGAGTGISVGTSRSRAALSTPIERMARPTPTRTRVHTCVNR